MLSVASPCAARNAFTSQQKRKPSAGTQLDLDALDAEQQRHYDALSSELEALLASQLTCTGDGNIDLVVDDLDLQDWQVYADGGGASSWYDVDLDGLTNEKDRLLIERNLGTDCRVR